MAEGRPHLVAVGEPAERPGRPAPARRPLAVPLLVVALALCAVGWGLARHEASRLASALAAEQSALAEVRARLTAAEAQRAQVRTQVQALAADAAAFAGRLGELEALVATDPQPAADTQATGNESPPAD